MGSCDGTRYPELYQVEANRPGSVGSVWEVGVVGLTEQSIRRARCTDATDGGFGALLPPIGINGFIVDKYSMIWKVVITGRTLELPRPERFDGGEGRHSEGRVLASNG